MEDKMIVQAPVTYGSVVTVDVERHDPALPYAIIIRGAQRVFGGGQRFDALFTDDFEQPTIWGRATLYADEIVYVTACHLADWRVTEALQQAEVYWQARR